MEGRIILLLTFSIISNIVFAQNNEDRIDNLRNVVPPSPNTSSLGRYGEWPVSLYTGLPNISIPIYELKGRSLSVPVSLSYHAAGIKVGDIASSVGLGWSLNAGGIISRSVRSWPDDDPSQGYFAKRQLYTNQNDLCSSPVNSGSAADHKVAAAKGEADSEQDLYSFNALGRSFNFFFKADGTVVPAPYSKVKITTNYLSMATSPDNISWAVIFEDGTKLLFGGSGCYEINANPRFDIGASYLVTSWLLKSITSTTGEVCSFTYTSASVEQDSYFSQSDFLKYNLSTINYNGTPCTEYISNYSGRSNAEKQQVTMLTVSTIETPLGRIDFELDTASRQDLKGGKFISAIKIFSKNENQYVEQYKLNYSYSQSVSSNEYWGGVQEADKNYYKKRLKLTSLEKASVSAVVDNRWVFEYNSLALPSRRSFAQDHWGFYNGAVGNTTLLPKYFYPLPNGVFNNYPNAGFNPSNYQKGGNREGDGNYSKAEMLQSIEYPTGGKTTFYSEANSVPDTAEIFVDTTGLLQLNLTSISNPFTTFREWTFTITKAQNVMFSLESYISPNIFNDLPGTTVSATVRKSSTQTVIAGMTSGTGESSFSASNRFNFFDTGTYILKISTNADQGSFGSTDAIIASVSFEYEKSHGFQPVNRNTGGLRLNKMVDYDGVDSTKSIEKNFVYENPLIISPVDIEKLYFTETEELTCENVSPPYYTSCENRIVTRNSSTKFSLGNVQGGTVGYGKVTTLYGNNGAKGKTVTEFSNETDYGLSEAEIFPYPPTDSRPWRRGLLLKRMEYNSFNTKLSVDSTTYSFTSKAVIASFKAGIYQSYSTDNVCSAVLCTESHGDCGIQKVCYNSTSEQVKHISSTQTVYDQNGLNPLTTITTNYYDNSENLQPVRIETTDSKGQVIKTIKRTPLEKSDINSATTLTAAASAAIDTMLARNIVSPVLQQEVYVNSVLQSRSLTNYKNWTTKILQPENVQVQTQSNPIETRLQYLRYDTASNLLEQRKINDVIHSYIWDYTSNYPIAECTNADSASVAYTSFEANGKGGWTFAGSTAADATSPTGKKIYTLTGSNNITKSSLSSGTTYIVSYWTKNSSAYSITGTISGFPVSGRTINGWKYFEHHITGQTTITISGSGVIDELRLYPEKSVMTTYAYEPLIGMTSQCDANNRISYYEYDGFGRLVLIRDQDKNVIKKICYNYAGQQETCSPLTYYNADKSQPFTRNNCPAGAVGSVVTYTVVANTYSSLISPQDADQKAQNDVNTNGQNYANTNGTCTFSSAAKIGVFTRNNCPVGGTGSNVTYTVAAGAYTSIINQADADQKAQNDVNTNGQNYANANGTCTFLNVVKIGTFTRNNCPSGQTGSIVTYTVAAGTYSSTISQANADQLAQNDVNNNGQNYANTQGVCRQTVNIDFEIVLTSFYEDEFMYYEMWDVTMRFYDQNLVPLELNADLNIKYKITSPFGNEFFIITAPANTSDYYVGNFQGAYLDAFTNYSLQFFIVETWW